MTKTTSGIAIIVLLLSSGISNAQDTLTITGVKFALPYLEALAEDYNKTSGKLKVVVKEEHDLKQGEQFLSVKCSPDDEQDDITMKIGRYVLLLIANTRLAENHKWHEKTVKPKEVRDWFYETFTVGETTLKKKKSLNATVYSLNNQGCAEKTLAAFFDAEVKDMKGRNVGGSLKYLLKAMQGDTNGISYSAPVFIYENGIVKEGIYILPLDLNGNAKNDIESGIYSSQANFEEYLRNSGVAALPWEYLYISIPENFSRKDRAIDFINWIIENSAQDGKAGFVRLDAEAKRATRIALQELETSR